MKRAAVHNLGCKVNEYETEAMQELLEKNGYKIVPFDETADVYVINTCSVTGVADKKSRQMLHRAKKNNPNAIIVACGCYVQAQIDAGQEIPDVDIIIGNNRKKDLVTLISEFEEQYGKDPIADVIDIHHTTEYEDLSRTKTGDRTRAFLKVQDGCNQFCSYCIIPYARGRVRSRRLPEVVAEVHTLSENGYKEIVLTGIHLSSYGIDFKEEPQTLLSLIKAVHEVPGIERIRLGSLEPRIITEEFAEALAGLPKICPHFHLSLQSGCDETLKRMNRRYDTAEYAAKCEILRKYFDNPALTTDVIVGFPQESEEDYRKSRDFVDSINFYETHIFKYSIRQGTRAAEMEGQIPEAVKQERSAEMLEMNRRKQMEYEKYWVGKEVEVLFEEPVKKGEFWYACGHTREYVKVLKPITEGEAAGYRNRIGNIKIINVSQIIH